MAKRTKPIGIRRRQSDEPYSVDYFARKHDISTEQARELMRRLGRNRDKLNEVAAKLFRKNMHRDRAGQSRSNAYTNMCAVLVHCQGLLIQLWLNAAKII